MIGVGFKVYSRPLLQRIRKRVDAAAYRNFQHAAASIRKTARQSITRGPADKRSSAKRDRNTKTRITRSRHAASRPGTPVHTQRGRAKAAIWYAADKHGARIGPRASVIGDAMEPHEFGGRYKGAEYPERPTMGPALVANLDRFANGWRGSIGER